MWFEKLTGFKEENPEQVCKNLEIEDEYLISKTNGNSYKLKLNIDNPYFSFPLKTSFIYNVKKVE